MTELTEVNLADKGVDWLGVITPFRKIANHAAAVDYRSHGGRDSLSVTV